MDYKITGWYSYGGSGQNLDTVTGKEETIKRVLELVSREENKKFKVITATAQKRFWNCVMTVETEWFEDYIEEDQKMEDKNLTILQETRSEIESTMHFILWSLDGSMFPNEEQEVQNIHKILEIAHNRLDKLIQTRKELKNR